MYLKAENYAHDGTGVSNPQTTAKLPCPDNCGICDKHLSHPALGLIDLTNRCNLECPICFANANAAGYVYEPSFEKVTNMLKMLRATRPVATPAVQFSGGEPTIYPRFLDVIRVARDLGFAQIQVATNGLTLARKPEFAQQMVDAGVNTVYLQFDSLDDKNYIEARGRPLVKMKLRAIANCRATKPRPLSVTLVPTILNTVNDDQVGPILKFAIENNDVIRAVNYQPVSFTGRIAKESLSKQRFTLPDLVERLKRQTGIITEDDMYPVPCVTSISEFVSVLTGKPKVNFTCHPHCGIATFLYVEDGGRAIPITRFVDVEGLFKELDRITVKAKGRKLTALQKLKLLKLSRYIDKTKAPSSFKLTTLLKSMLARGDKEGLRPITWSTIMVGGMHFQDSYNYDIERVKRCVIHYATPDGRIIPFCTYNGGPSYRIAIEKKFGVPLAEWRKSYGQ
jgi:hypothetical protein